MSTGPWASWEEYNNSKIAWNVYKRIQLQRKLYQIQLLVENTERHWWQSQIDEWCIPVSAIKEIIGDGIKDEQD